MEQRRKDKTFSDLIHEVQKLTTAQLEHGKDSKQYQDQHTKSIGIIKELNSVNGHGYASLSKARSVIQMVYSREKESKRASLERSQRNRG